MKLPSVFLRIVAFAAVLIFAVAVVPEASAQHKDVAVAKTWKGNVDDDALLKDVAPCVTTAVALEKLWKEWKVAGEVPKVDFTKQIVVITTTKGSMVQAAFRLDEKGNLQSVGMATMDYRPGFRYVLATVDRAGIKTIDGKAVPAP